MRVSTAALQRNLLFATSASEKQGRLMSYGPLQARRVQSHRRLPCRWPPEHCVRCRLPGRHHWGVTGAELIRVLVVDDHRMVREGLRSYLGLVDDIAMVGDASDGRSALDWLARSKARGALPDVVLMDLLMEPMGGLEATAAIKRLYPEVKVVAVTSFLDEVKVHAALEAGAAGYLLKDAEADEVAAAVRAAQRGEVHVDVVVARQLTASLRRGPSADPAALLTARERESPGAGGAGQGQ